MTCSNHVQDGDSMSSWCGWHTDHGSLTGLTCGMFTRDGIVVPCPDNAAGLYIRTRTDQIVKVVYGEDEIAYQIGETTEILSRGFLCATPHCVRAPNGRDASGVDRSTFALFMQPDWDEKLNFPEEVHILKEVSNIKSYPVMVFGHQLWTQCDTIKFKWISYIWRILRETSRQILPPENIKNLSSKFPLMLWPVGNSV
ncbi:hypothetical protein Patl1_13188 [Pistacia atlantica]|uniref:Uncharacterized protein n=1 Tax=Pistacia atlantica TaxID=434234 RepID=A0ACC1ARX0_9ROSI|nr:hypothetical protein Patl1_13188 [Pistacia atlantica]